jgi:hypothetical protein
MFVTSTTYIHVKVTLHMPGKQSSEPPNANTASPYADNTISLPYAPNSAIIRRCCALLFQFKTNSVVFTPQANYTD